MSDRGERSLANPMVAAHKRPERKQPRPGTGDTGPPRLNPLISASASRHSGGQSAAALPRHSLAVVPLQGAPPSLPRVTPNPLATAARAEPGPPGPGDEISRSQSEGRPRTRRANPSFGRLQVAVPRGSIASDAGLVGPTEDANPASSPAPPSGRLRRRSTKQRRSNNVKSFSSLSRTGTTQNQALPSVYARSRRVRVKRLKRRAFFLLETGKASTTSTKRIRGLIILIVLLSVTGAMVETTVVEVDEPAFKHALYLLGLITEIAAAIAMLVDVVMRTWACTVDSRLSKQRTFIPGIWKANDRPGCALSCGPPPGALEVDSLGRVVDADEPHQDERPRRCGVKCVGRLQYAMRPWNIIELSTFVPVLIWVVSAGAMPVFGLSQWAHGLRFLRLLRVVVLRRMFPGVRLLFKVVASKARELSSALIMALIVAIIVGSMVYELERPRAAKTPFRTLFDGAYWSTIS